MKLKTWVMLGILFVLVSAVAFADSPVENYNFTCSEIPATVLHDTIGVITINASWSWEPSYHVDDVQLQLCENTSDGFINSGTISLQKETRCLTSYGYSGIGSYRYPVIVDTDNYCCIIIDPKLDKRVWIDKKELAKTSENAYEVSLFDSLKNVQVDLFFFTNSKKKKIYVNPSKDSPFTVIDEKTYGILEVAETKDGFVRLVIFDSDPANKSGVKSVGWARVRDNDGLLSIWVIDADEC